MFVQLITKHTYDGRKKLLIYEKKQKEICDKQRIGGKYIRCVAKRKIFYTVLFWYFLRRSERAQCILKGDLLRVFTLKLQVFNFPQP